MIFKIFIWVSSFSVFLFIDHYCTLLISFSTFILLAYFSHRLRLMFLRIVSRRIEAFKKLNILNQLTYFFVIVSYFSKFMKQLLYLIKNLFAFQNVSYSAQSPNYEFCGEIQALKNEIDTLVQKISQFYLYSWYNKISDSDEFVSLLSDTIRETLNRLCDSVLKVEKKRISYIVLQMYLHYFYHFVEAEKNSEILRLKNTQMKHWAMKDASTERCYLQSLVSALVDRFGPSENDHSLHSKYCSLLHAIVVEILTETLIQPLVNVLCDPSRINLLILKILLNNLQNENILPSNKYSSKDTSKAQPVIIMPSDEGQKPFSNDELSSPEMYSKNQVDFHNVEDSSSEKMNMTSIDIASLFSSGVKSSSDNYLSDNEHNNLKQIELEENSSILCDNTVIKRSKSADYIRQMPQLKALNEKGYDIKLQKDKILVSVKTESNSNCSIEQAEEAVEIEVPTLFTDINIIDTVQQNEDGILPYTLYCIEYLGIFHDTRNSSDSPFVPQVISIKRRFSEFVTLQARLEDNPELKNHLKGIKGPSKWSTLPFSNLDRKYIAERRLFLETYLRALCAIAPIAQSSELQEFLAYGGDARISFVRRTGDINVPRIDKFLVRQVKGAFDMFKTALEPNSSMEVEGIDPGKTDMEDTNPGQRFHEYLLDFSSREPEVKEHIKNYFQNSMGNSSSDLVSHKGKNSDSKLKRSSLLRNLPNFIIEDCCKCVGLHDMYSEEENPFGDTVIELLDVAIELNSKKLGDLRTKLISLLSPFINRFAVHKIDNISEHHLTSLLHSLHKYLWPDEVHEFVSTVNQNDSSNIDKISDCLEVLISSHYFLHNSVYSTNSFVLEKIKLFILSLQHEEMNKCLLFHIFDAVIEHVCEKKE